MNKITKLAVLITLGMATLVSCSSNIPLDPGAGTLNVGTDGNFMLTADGDQVAVMPSGETGNQEMKKGPGGPHGHGPGGIGLPPELNLTDDQKKQLEALRQENKPPQPPDRSNMDEGKKVVDAAFLSDSFDVSALQAKLDALRPSDDEHLAFDANMLIKTYNILTQDQRDLLEKLQQDGAPKTPVARPTPSAEDIAKMVEGHLAKITTLLSLDETQQAALKPLLQPPAPPDFQADQEKRKATHDAINSELKSGNATVESVVAILKANRPADPHAGELDRLAKIHDILNADQRKTFLEKGIGFGPGGKGPEGPHGGPGGRPGPGGDMGMGLGAGKGFAGQEGGFPGGQQGAI
jgi:Spy/CpxP family protein refolding chaperone